MEFAVFRAFWEISRDFAGPRPREISEALFLSPQRVYIFSIFTLTLVLPQQHRLHSGRSREGPGGPRPKETALPPPLLSQVLDPALLQECNQLDRTED